MPSPATHLRAPLLWLLLPLMAGLTAAKLWPLPACGLWPLVAGAGGLSLLAVGLARASARISWMLSIAGAGALGGFPPDSTSQNPATSSPRLLLTY